VGGTPITPRSTEPTLIDKRLIDKRERKKKEYSKRMEYSYQQLFKRKQKKN
jgi:hypothetical protein